MPLKRYPRRKLNRRKPRRPVPYTGKRAAMVRAGMVHKSIPSVSHVFKRKCGPVQITNSGSTAPQITTTCNGWQIGGFSASAFGTTTQFGLSANFQLQDVIESTDFTQLFDRYKIVGIKLKFMYQQTTSANSGVVSNVHPIMDMSFDGDDSDLPVSQTAVQVKGFSKTHLLNSNRPFKTYWTPRVDKVVYTSGISTAYTSERSCWLDCNSPQVQHYGMKAWITSWPFDTNLIGTQPAYGELTIQPTYYIAFKDSQ